jgi:hypothetical protein
LNKTGSRANQNDREAGLGLHVVSIHPQSRAGSWFHPESAGSAQAICRKNSPTANPLTRVIRPVP